MQLFKVEFERHVSRTVELRQTASLYIQAPDQKTAQDAAWDIAASRDVEEHGGQWEDDDGSRVASNDSPEGPERVVRCAAGKPVFTSDQIVSAIEVLGLDPKEHDET